MVIASLLSKKLAVGVKNVCLDIRYSKFGNFGKSLQEFKLLSMNFKDVADLLGIKSNFYFSNNDLLMQPYIGRGESLLAIDEYLSGMIFYKNQNEHVSVNDLILTYRVTQDDWELFQAELTNIITIID